MGLLFSKLTFFSFLLSLSFPLLNKKTKNKKQKTKKQKNKKTKKKQTKKQKTKKKQPFSVKFKGEGATDAGGPYRECITQCFQESFSTMNLFVPCGNAVANVGLNEDLCVPNARSCFFVFLFLFFCFFVFCFLFFVFCFLFFVFCFLFFVFCFLF